MSKFIDTKKDQIKYITGRYRHLSGYPTPLDVLHDICERYSLLKDDSFYDNKFYKTIGYPIEFEEFQEKLEALVEMGHLEKTNKGKENYSHYKIISNPWE